ncbi:MAG: ankyrin repeat domain-containing protein [Rivularia sp. T60_A2020_040]|nr:ankyrin repeat domain-containing protein [Rivularia sp. T60_A2020_040]
MKIHDYIRKGDINEVTRLIKKGIEINCVDEDSDCTPLMVAVSSLDANVDMVRLLVENGADINEVESQFQDTVLGLAVKAGNFDKIRFLLDVGADINYRTPSGYDVLINAMYGRDITQDEYLIPILNLLIERGAEVDGMSNYGETALKVASSNARFDAVKLLLDAGAEEKQLQWTSLMKAVVFGSLEEVQISLEQGADIYHVDCWNRNAFILSLEIGDLFKAKLILPFTPTRNDLLFWWKSPLFYAIKHNSSAILEWLIEEGFEIEATDEYLDTPLILAAEYGATDCVKILLEAGADTSKVNNYQENALNKAANLEIVKMLVVKGEDTSDINNEIRVLLTGVGNQELQLEEIKDKTQRIPRYGINNPEIIQNEFWQAMVCSGVDAYSGRSDEEKRSFVDAPIWCYQRFGRTITILPDGKIVEIAGEHEDFYDPDFYIYNDVVVFDGKGNFQIYGYPRDVFPPTDFHSATLVKNYIYIIGSLGYQNERNPNETPVYRLDCNTFKIERIKTTGDKPGWISSHKAKYHPPSQIYITGGKLWTIVDGEKDYIDNSLNYTLDLTNFEWTKPILSLLPLQPYQ